MPLIIFIISLALLCLPLASFAIPPHKEGPNELIIEKDKIFQSDVLSFDSLTMFEKNFNFDWNNAKTFSKDTRKKVSEIQNFINNTSTQEFKKLQYAERQALGRLLYKAGCYYVHVSRQPDLAIARMDLANRYLTTKQEKAWNYNQLAYAYQLKYAKTNETQDKEKSLFYANKVCNEMYKNNKNREVAFAYSVKGLVQKAAENFLQAEQDFTTALNIYENLPGGKDAQYARTKNRLAALMLEEHGKEYEALRMLEELQIYWSAQPNIKINPYAAKNQTILAEAYLKNDEAQKALAEIQFAVKIYQDLYGKDSQLLVEPYQIMSDVYRLLGDVKLADSYQIKANELDRS